MQALISTYWHNKTVSSRKHPAPMDVAFGNTLEEIFKFLVDEAFRYNLSVENWLDLVDAIYPPDSSEVDEDHEAKPARKLTEEIVEELAEHVWEVPSQSLSWFDKR